MAYLRSAESCARERHPVRTWGGRLVRFGDPDTAAAEQPAQLAARGRYGRNAVIQGAAAELFKAWAATVRHGVASLDGRIVLCLHDELVLHVPESVVGEASELLTDALASMTSWWAAGSGVRFVAEVTSGTNWADAH
jgi:DNA polymerase-1